MILDDIVAHKRNELAAQRRAVPLSDLQSLIPALPAPLDFAAALARPGVALIAEVKRASPSKGVLCPDFDPVRLATTYAAHGAAAISVLTDSRFFQGDLKYLTDIWQALRSGSPISNLQSPIPVLRKDFIFHPYQVYETRAHGADALLLIAAILSDGQLAELLALTHELGMTALLEVHDEAEMTRALRCSPRVMGINNRNLRDLSVDLATFGRLRPMLPAGTLAVAESGVRTAADVCRLAGMGADAVLVGEALVTAPDVAAKVRELTSYPGRARSGDPSPIKEGGDRRLEIGEWNTMTLVKICGITNLEDARGAVEAGADFLGFVFYPRSPRYVTPEQVRDIVTQISDLRSPISNLQFSNLHLVGVFVDEPPEAVAQTLEFCGLDYAQLHGAEPPEMVAALMERGIRVIKAFRVGDGFSPAEMARYRPTAYLLDTCVPGQSGGTGHTFDWALAVQARRHGPLILAGGLTPGNVARAVRRVRPWAVDVASGVEAAPGRKDHDELRRFIAAARSVPMAHPTQSVPDERGYFGPYGGRFVPETLMPALAELEAAYRAARADPDFQRRLDGLLRDYVGRPTPLTFAARLTEHCGGAKIYLKREDLAHTGAHKINNTLGQGLLAERMGKRRLVAETGAGQHGVATATIAAWLGMECVVYMGSEDMRRQRPNVFRMRLLGAEVRPVDAGRRTLKDAINEAIRDWVTNVRTTHYLLGSVLGPHPYPTMVRDFQSVIGREAREQILAAEGRLPDALIACVGGGSNAMGLFHAFRHDPVELIGVEAGGLGLESGRHAARFAGDGRGRVGVLHGTKTYVLQSADGQIAATHSISAGLDYPAVGPEHSFLRDLGRARYTVATDRDALAAFDLLCRLEGIIPALESAHAVAEAVRLAPHKGRHQIVVVNLSGRGDKDLDNVAQARNGE